VDLMTRSAPSRRAPRLTAAYQSWVQYCTGRMRKPLARRGAVISLTLLSQAFISAIFPVLREELSVISSTGLYIAENAVMLPLLFLAMRAARSRAGWLSLVGSMTTNRFL